MSKSLNYRNVFWSKAPDYWEHIQIGGIIKKVNKRYKHSDLDDIKVLSVTNDKGFIKPEDKFDKKVASENLDNYKLVFKNQFAYNPSRINVGSIAFLEDFDKGLISPMYEVFEIKDNKVDLDFIKYFFKSYKAISLYDAYSQGSVRQTLKFDLMKKIPYVLPPLPEQKKIASILSSVDKSIEKTDEVIEETKELKKGLMQELLTKGIRHSEFKEVRVGPKTYKIPTKWNINNLNPKNGFTKKVTDGSHHSPNQSDDGQFHYATVTNLSSNGINFTSCNRINKEAYGNLVSSGCKPEINDVLFSKDGTVGISAVFDDERDVVLLSSIAIIRPTDKIYPYYLKYYLSSRVIRDQIRSFKSGTAIRRVVLRDIKKFKIMLPPLEEQKKIASILSSVDAKIKKEEEYKTKLERLKKGLMQKLLTGEIRVNTEMEV